MAPWRPKELRDQLEDVEVILVLVVAASYLGTKGEDVAHLRTKKWRRYLCEGVTGVFSRREVNCVGVKGSRYVVTSLPTRADGVERDWSMMKRRETRLIKTRAARKAESEKLADYGMMCLSFEGKNRQKKNRFSKTDNFKGSSHLLPYGLYSLTTTEEIDEFLCMVMGKKDLKHELGHMTGNKDHLDDFEECKGGSVTFGGSKGYITGKGRIRVGNLDYESEFL
ncbi:hypothetical protein Tco_0135291 [Tanacetum coccineum]